MWNNKCMSFIVVVGTARQYSRWIRGWGQRSITWSSVHTEVSWSSKIGPRLPSSQTPHACSRYCYLFLVRSAERREKVKLVAAVVGQSQTGDSEVWWWLPPPLHGREEEGARAITAWTRDSGGWNLSILGFEGF